MTFGRGIHRCLGSHLARLEMKVMAQVVLERMPDYTIDVSKLRLHPDVGITYGYESVPIASHPRPLDTLMPACSACNQAIRVAAQVVSETS